MEPITLTSDRLDVGLVEYLSKSYVVTVYEDNGEIKYQLDKVQQTTQQKI